MTDDLVEVLEFTDDHYIALGKMVIAFQRLEQCITFGAAFLLSPDSYEKAVGTMSLTLNELSFAKRLSLFSIYVKSAKDDFAKSEESSREVKPSRYLEFCNNLNDAIKSASKAEERRNQIMHSRWITDVLGGHKDTVLRLKHRVSMNKISLVKEYISADCILKDVDGMNATAESIFNNAYYLSMLLKEN